MAKRLQGFFAFLKEHSVLGLAIGFILGGSINATATSFINDIVQPLIGLLFGSVNGLAALQIGPLMYGRFLVSLLNFLFLAFVMYLLFKALKIETKK